MTDLATNSSGPVVPPADGGAQDPGSLSLAEMLDNNAVVSVTEDVIVVTRALRETDIAPGTATREMGYTAPSPFTSWTRRDQNTKLEGQAGIQVYYNMRRQDGAVRAAMRLAKTPIQGAHWFVEPYIKNDSSEPTAQDVEIAKFVAEDIFECMNVPWATFLGDVLLMCDYGYMAFEKVWEFRADGKVHLRKLGPRHPLDIQEWEYDFNGGPNGCKMFSNPYSGPSPVSQGSGMDALTERFIPIVKLVVFSHEPEAGDITGISILRSAYKHWYYKDTLYKIDAIQKERHGIGVPVIQLPPGFTTQDRLLAEDLGRNLRTNERAHVVLPPNWVLTFAKLEGQMVDCMKSIEHHDMRIKSNVLGAFLDATSGTSDPNIDIFLKSTRYIADYIADIFNAYVIPQMVDLNFRRPAEQTGRYYPKLRARRIGEWEDLRTLSFALRNFVGADIIRADDVMEAHLRKEMDLPPSDPKTTRTPIQVRPALAGAPSTGTSGDSQQPAVGAAPNGGVKQDAANNRPGMPRQTPKANVGLPKKNAGTDRSGG